MTAHVVYDALDGANPATLSPAAMTDLARGQLAFAGALISDDLEMRAVSERASAGELAVAAIAAGCDLLLVCSREEAQDEAFGALVRAAEGQLRVPRPGGRGGAAERGAAHRASKAGERRRARRRVRAVGGRGGRSWRSSRPGPGAPRLRPRKYRRRRRRRRATRRKRWTRRSGPSGRAREPPRIPRAAPGHLRSGAEPATAAIRSGWWRTARSWSERTGGVAYVGPASAAQVGELGASLEDVGDLLTPGLVDAHTHAAWVGSRHAEYLVRMSGGSYTDIAAAGGGILSSSRAVAAATEEDIAGSLRARLGRMAALGVTCIEVKSGYGLDGPRARPSSSAPSPASPPRRAARTWSRPSSRSTPCRRTHGPATPRAPPT